MELKAYLYLAVVLLLLLGLTVWLASQRAVYGATVRVPAVLEGP